MKTQLTVLALAATSIGALAACSPGATTPGTRTVAADAAAGRSNPLADAPVPVPSKATSDAPATKTTAQTAKKTKKAKIVSFKLVQKPKCAEGTAVFRAPSVPAIIKWKITGATGAALSVDDATHTAGTYGPEPVSGTETFTFGCNGPVGSTEKHTYAIYTVGGGKQRSLTITATAKVLDNGQP